MSHYVSHLWFGIGVNPGGIGEFLAVHYDRVVRGCPFHEQVLVLVLRRKYCFFTPRGGKYMYPSARWMLFDSANTTPFQTAFGMLDAPFKVTSEATDNLVGHDAWCTKPLRYPVTQPATRHLQRE